MSDKIETIDVGAVDWNATAVQYMELNKQKTEAIQRVRELHFDNGFGNCITCYQSWENGFSVSVFPIVYPCPTIKALDGEQE